MVVVFEKKLEQFEKAFLSLKRALDQERNEFVRDSIIQRFEFCTEMMWKALKYYLLEKNGIEVKSPKEAMREARNLGLLKEKETIVAIQMLDDRNQTSHTYDEDFALEMIENIEDYVELMGEILRNLKSNL